ncbi:hypothetical protein R5R35_014514 [Gryllus longicercus]|uniref:G-protein coupled receptors family 1 profile domain-containing protein n=1 Tax=Gryllus longicercus TaxID=2509291 RepID=A0AAN9VMX4_9ORTH
MAEAGGLPASSPLLEMASLRLPDSEELDLDARRRGDAAGVLTSSSTPLHLAARAHAYRPAPAPHPLTNFSRSIMAESSGYLTDLFGNTIKVATNHSAAGHDAADKGEQGDALYNGSLALNASGNVTAALGGDLFYRHSLAMTLVYCVAYVLVFAVGLIGNCFVIAVVFRTPRMRTVTNFFIVNLAVADILVIVFCLPATLMSNIFVREYGGGRASRSACAMDPPTAAPGRPPSPAPPTSLGLLRRQGGDGGGARRGRGPPRDRIGRARRHRLGLAMAPRRRGWSPVPAPAPTPSPPLPCLTLAAGMRRQSHALRRGHWAREVLCTSTILLKS